MYWRGWRQVQGLGCFGQRGGAHKILLLPQGALPLLACLLLLRAPARCLGGAAAPPACVRASEMADADAFQFPFAPYAVQTELMTSVYSALNEGQVGIFESPTGVSL